MLSSLRSASIFAVLLVLTSAAPARGQSISGVEPSTPYPGHPVTISGSGFTGANDVTYNGTSVSFRKISDSEIRARVPLGATSDASFEVTTSSGTATSSTVTLDTDDGLYGPKRTLTFDGSGDYVEVGDEEDLDLTGDFTVEFWMKVDGDGFNDQFEALVTKGDDSWRVQRHSTNSELTFDTSHDNGSDFHGLRGSTPVDDGKWHHVAAVYDRTSGEKRLYVDGALDASAAESREVDDSDFRVRIGSNAEVSGREFGGQIDQVRIWNTVLSTQQVRARARRTVDPSTPGLVASFRLDASSSTTAFEQTDSYRFGTFQGDPQRATVSSAQLGQESAATTGTDATVGPSGGTVSATNVSAGSGEAVQLYRFGALGDPVRTGSDPGEDLSRLSAGERSNLTWGLGVVGSPSADVTIEYSGVSNVSTPVALLRRDGPGDPWQRATGWSQDESAQTFTRPGTVPEGQYAVAPDEIIFVDTDATGAADGSSWTDAYTDVQTAIDNASSSHEIWVAEGIYTPDSEGDSFSFTGAKDGLEIYGGFAGTETSRSGRDPGANPTILSGDLNSDDTDPDGDDIIEDASDLQGGENAHHVFFLDGTSGGNITTSTVIDGVIVTAGQADGSSDINKSGAGLFCDGQNSGNECSPTLRNVVFAGHAADFVGGAIHNRGMLSGVSSPVITNAVFIGNTAVNDGGAIYNNAQEDGTSSPQITNVTFTNNTADGLGGAIYNTALVIAIQRGTSEPQITNVILWGNSAASGGDEIYNAGTGAEPTISHSIVQGSGGSSNWDSSLGTDGGGNLDQDPQFGDAADPTGPDGTFATQDDGVNVLAGSPALDAGDNAAVPSGVTTDITGADRTQDRDGNGTATVNVGAYEEAYVGPPTAQTGSASGVTGTTANLGGTVNPRNAETTVQAQVYPTSDPSDVRNLTDGDGPFTGTSDQSVTVSIDGLAPSTEYEARIIASNSKGGDRGNFVTFTTTSEGYVRSITGTDGTGNDAGWRMLALPAADKTRAALEDDLEFNVSSGSILYRWTSGSWTAQTNTTDNLPRARGFMLYFFDDPFETIDSKGISLAVSTGPEDQTKDKTVSSLAQSETFFLLGNPYDAAFDLGSLAGGDLPAAGFQATVQVWDPGVGSYTQITQGKSGDEIAAWQGFFVERSTEGAGQNSLTFSASGKLNSDGSLIGSKSASLLAGGSAAGKKTPPKRAQSQRARLELRLAVTGEASEDDTTPPGPSGKSGAWMSALASPTRDTSRSGASPAAVAKEAETDTLARSQATVLFAEEATGGWDAYETTQLTPFSSGGYATLSSPLLRATSSQEDSTLVRRALASEPYPRDTSAIRLPLSVRSVGTGGEATIRWPEQERSLPDGWTVQLVDTETGGRVDLRAESYSFELADGDGEVETPSDSRFRLAVGPASAIPVELAAFEARRSEGAGGEPTVRLTWQTASETNNAGFHVQRRIPKASDGRPTEAWQQIEFIESKAEGGTTSEPQTYRFTDADLPFAADTLTYRLKQVDLDGTAHFTEEVVVERAGAREVALKPPFPNPARGQATVQYALPESRKVRLVVYDVLGRRVQTLVQGRQKAGRRQVRLDASRLSSGTYLLRLTAGGAAKTRKVTVVR